jgi:2-polyprenyl-3-methyl-5-hydroxy-6-metoxy-1,4-benzoquinol methylase
MNLPPITHTQEMYFKINLENQYDMVLIIEIEHVAHPDIQFLKQVSTLVKPACYFLGNTFKR